MTNVETMSAGLVRRVSHSVRASVSLSGGRNCYPLTVLLLAVALAHALSTSAVAQDGASAIRPHTDTPTVTAAATVERVRFAAPNAVVQMRLEVYNEAGQKVLDTELRGGSVLDWHLQSGAGERVAEGAYLCVLTVKSLSGRLSQKLGTVTVGSQTAAVQSSAAAQFNPAQAQAVGPVEADAAFVVLSTDTGEAATVLTHNGSDGQLSRTRGALTFRVGNFFAGSDKEQMRLTEEGNLGIGTAKPKVKLDVAGMIRAREGFQFFDGSKLNVNDKGALTLTNSNGNIVPNVAGTGTQNRLAKWTDNSGTLGDSIVSEAGGTLQLSAPVSATVDTNILFLDSTSKTTGVLGGSVPAFEAANGPFFAMRGNTYTAIGGGNQKGLFAISAGDIAGATGRQGSIVFNTGPDQVRMAIKPSGDVGIGTETPSARLDVTGDINTTTQFNIRGNRVLTVTGGGLSDRNIFAGVLAGQANPTGVANAFFGRAAGLANTSGNGNSFFGADSGLNLNSGTSNSFFGTSAGGGITTGNNNTAIGANTIVSNNLDHAMAIGADAVVSASNTIALGRNSGADTVLVPGALTVNGTLNATLPVGSGNYIQNTTSPQTSSNFNISGTGSADIFDATTQYNIGGQRVLTVANGNLIVGLGSGNLGFLNSYFGNGAGGNLFTGFRNSFFGAVAGGSNRNGSNNSFFGAEAGEANTTDANFVSGQNNSFFGTKAGISNTTGSSNSFFGVLAGLSNTTENNNTFIGASSNGAAGITNATAVGFQAAVTQSNSLVLGSINGFNNATADTKVGIGTTSPTAKLTVSGEGVFNAAGAARFDLSNTTANVSFFQHVLDDGRWQLATTAGNQTRILVDPAGNVGLGNNFPDTKLNVVSPDTQIRFGVSTSDNGGYLVSTAATQAIMSGGARFNGSNWVAKNTAASQIANQSGQILFYTNAGLTAGTTFTPSEQMRITPGGQVGINTINPMALLDVNGTVRVGTLASGGSTTPLCLTVATGFLANCSSSSIRYKEQVKGFSHGLDIVRRLRPVSFRWKDGGEQDFGFIAEEVNQVEPRLVIRNKEGQVDGVRYDRLGVVLIDALREQQTQIESLRQSVTSLQRQNEQMAKRWRTRHAARFDSKTSRKRKTR